MRVCALACAAMARLRLLHPVRGRADGMHDVARALVVASGLLATGCITSFRHPLGPPEEGFIDDQLRGAWSCATDEGTPLALTIVDFDGKRYYLESREQGKGEPDRFRAHATRVQAAAFLNVQEIGKDGSDEWTLVSYAIAPDGRLQLRHVDPDPFQDVLDDPEAVRERLDGRLEDPEVITDLLSCARAPEGR